MIELRCSSLPRIALCPQSQHAPAIRIEGEDDAARLGTAAHIIAAHLVKGMRPLYGETVAIAHEHKVDPDELQILARQTEQCWDSLAEMFPVPVVEAELSHTDWDLGITLSGHPDVFSIVGTQARVPDFKTGRMIDDHDAQLKGYGWLLMRSYSELTDFWGATVHVRQGKLGDPVIMTRAELEAWFQELADAVRQDFYRPSIEACRYCPRRFECPARLSMLQSEAGALIGLDHEGVKLAWQNDAALRQGVIAAKHLKSVCENYLSAAKTEAILRGGVPGLEIRTEERRTLKSSAWGPLVEQIGLDRVQEAAKLSKSKIEQAIRDIAPKGCKGKLVKETLDRLEAEGHLEVSAIEKLEVVPLRVEQPLAALESDEPLAEMVARLESEANASLEAL